MDDVQAQLRTQREIKLVVLLTETEKILRNTIKNAAKNALNLNIQNAEVLVKCLANNRSFFFKIHFSLNLRCSWDMCSAQTIFLQDNAIGQIRHRDLSDLGQLHYLYLQNNSISTLESGAFRNLGLLLELALNGNRIHTVTADVFRGLDHLRILYLAGNQITRLEDYTFRGLQVKEHVRLYICLHPCKQ